MTNAGRPCSANVEDVLHAIESSSNTSTRRITHHISQQTAVGELHDQLLHPFYIQHVQAVQLLLHNQERQTSMHHKICYVIIVLNVGGHYFHQFL